MTVATPTGTRWRVDAPEPVGPPETLLARLLARAGGRAVALGVDCPIGLPSAFATLHATTPDFPSYLRQLGSLPDSSGSPPASRNAARVPRSIRRAAWPA
jgi:hypothetical protein